MAQKRTSEEWLILISKGLKELRKAKGYSSYETFALDNGLDRKQYWRLENGTNVTIKTLIRVLEIHDKELHEFFNAITKSPAKSKKIKKPEK